MKFMPLLRIVNCRSILDCCCTRCYFFKNNFQLVRSVKHFSFSVVSRNVKSLHEPNEFVGVNTKSTPLVLEKFVQLSEEKDFTNVIINPALKECTTVISKLSPKQFFDVVEVLAILTERFPDLYYYDDTIMALAEEIDRKFTSLLFSCNEESIVELIAYSHVLPHRSLFLINMVKKVSRFVQHWSTPNVVKVVNYLNNHVNAWYIYKVDKYKIELALMNHLPYLKIDDVGVFLKGLTLLKSELATPGLAEKLVDRFIEESSQAKPETIKSFLRYFSCQGLILSNNKDVNEKQKILALVKAVQDNVKEWPLEDLYYVSDMLIGLYCYDVNFYEKYAQKLIHSDEFYELTPWNLYGAIYQLSHWQYLHNQENVCKLLLNRIKCDPTYTLLKTHPRFLLRILAIFSKIGVYDYDLLNIVLTKGFLLEAYDKLNKYKIKKEVFVLDENVSLDCPDYYGSRLSKEFRDKIAKSWKYQIPILFDHDHKETFELRWRRAEPYTKFFYKLSKLLANMLGDDNFVHVCHLQPHIARENILVAMCNNIPQPLNSLKNETIVKKSMMNENYNWYTFILQHRNSLPPYQPLLSINSFHALRCMKKMNLNVIRIIIPEWNAMNEEDKIAFLKNNIYTASDNDIQSKFAS